MNTETIAAELLDALERNTLVTPITLRDPSFGVEAAYEMSAEVLRPGARDEKRSGRKIGFTNRTIWPEYGVYAPIWAPVYDSPVMFLEGKSGSLAIGHLAQPRIDPEIVPHSFRVSSAALAADGVARGRGDLYIGDTLSARHKPNG